MRIESFESDDVETFTGMELKTRTTEDGKLEVIFPDDEEIPDIEPGDDSSMVHDGEEDPDDPGSEEPGEMDMDITFDDDGDGDFNFDDADADLPGEGEAKGGGEGEGEGDPGDTEISFNLGDEGDEEPDDSDKRRFASQDSEVLEESEGGGMEGDKEKEEPEPEKEPEPEPKATEPIEPLTLEQEEKEEPKEEKTTILIAARVSGDQKTHVEALAERLGLNTSNLLRLTLCFDWTKDPNLHGIFVKAFGGVQLSELERNLIATAVAENGL